VAIGRAIVRQPKVFLFDEPLSNLDAALRVDLRIELARLHQQLGTTMFLGSPRINLIDRPAADAAPGWRALWQRLAASPAAMQLGVRPSICIWPHPARASTRLWCWPSIWATPPCCICACRESKVCCRPSSLRKG
jgi:multiple sugar transport system ATP-binding protein